MPKPTNAPEHYVLKPVYTLRLVREGDVHAQPRTTNPHEIARVISSYLRDVPYEHFVVASLSTSLRLIGIHNASNGDIDCTLASPRLAFVPALLCNGAAIIHAHNHPSGDPTPSKDDHALHKRLTESGRILGVSVIDGLIIGADSYYAFAADEIYSLLNP